MDEALPPTDASKSSADSVIIESESTGQVARSCRNLSSSLNKLTDFVNSLTEPANSLTKPVNSSIDSSNSQPKPIPIQPKPPMFSSQLPQMVNPIMMMVPGPSPYFMPLIQQPTPRSPNKKESQSADRSKPVPIAPAGFGYIPVMTVPFTYAAVPPGNSPFELISSYVQNPLTSETMMFAGATGNFDNKSTAEVPIKAKRGRPRKVRLNETASTNVPLQKVLKTEINDQSSLACDLNSSSGTSAVPIQVPKRRGRKPLTVNKLIHFPSIYDVQPMEDSNDPSDQPVDYCVKEKN